MLPGLSSLTNSGSMPISGGDAGPATATSSTNSGQRIGAINMGGSKSVSIVTILAFVVVFFLVLKK